MRLRLLPTDPQKIGLLSVMERLNAAATFAAQAGFRAEVFSQPSLHKLCYRETRERFGLSTQLAVRAIGKAVEVFRRDRSVCPAFKPRGAVTYDDRTRFRREDRAKFSGWSFSQLRTFVEYKARLAGVPVVLVDPRDTSRACSACGHCEKANRRNQAEFACQRCGFALHADHNGARNVPHGGILSDPDLAADADSGLGNRMSRAARPRPSRVGR